MEAAAKVAKPTPFRTIITKVFSSQGRPRQKRMSKMLEPIELQMAISARPAFFTIKYELISSGMLVPAAKIVIPDTVSGMPRENPKSECILLIKVHRSKVCRCRLLTD